MNTPELLKETIPAPNRTKMALMAVVAVLVTNGLILTCWGWADWRGFFAHPARCVVVAMMIFRFAHGMFTSHPNSFGRGRDDKRVRERGFFTLLIASALLVMASPYFDARGLWILPGGDATRSVGLLLFVAGFVLAYWAVIHLGLFSGHVTRARPAHSRPAGKAHEARGLTPTAMPARP
jgi:hypothetical protein